MNHLREENIVNAPEQQWHDRNNRMRALELTIQSYSAVSVEDGDLIARAARMLAFLRDGK